MGNRIQKTNDEIIKKHCPHLLKYKTLTDEDSAFKYTRNKLDWIFCILFTRIYEHYSYGEHSTYMRAMFLFPLICGSLLSLLSYDKGFTKTLGRRSYKLGIGTVKSAYSLRDEDGRRDLMAIHVPTIIIHGKKDQVMTNDLVRIQHDQIKGTTLY